jgi:hypothetical protein
VLVRSELGERQGRQLVMMNCEEFELCGLDLDRRDAEPREAAAAAQHAEVCPRCRAMLESWREVKGDLRLLREATWLHSAPPRVEMRLKQELRTRREVRVPFRRVAVATWALAAVAVLAAGLGWRLWRDGNARPGRTVVPSVSKPAASRGDAAMLLADSDTGAFTRLPGSMPSPYENQAILQVRMQRGALGRFGFPVAQDRAAEWVQVDFLIGEDGLPQAVRLHQDSQTGPTLQ